MTIENLTIKEAKQKLLEYKELEKLFNIQSNIETIKRPNLFDSYIGRYVICRTRNEGINAGTVVQADETGVILKNARRLYYHKPIDKTLSWYEGVALSGISNDSKVGCLSEKIIIENYSLTVCTEIAKKSIMGAKSNEQS